MPGTDVKEGETVKFSRGGGAGGRHAAEDPRRSGRRPARPDGDERTDDWTAEPVDPTAPGILRRRVEQVSTGEPEGPFDIADAPPGVHRYDFGSIQVPADEDVEIRVQDAGGGVIQHVVLTHAGSALLLVAFAAPRTEAIWDEVRGDFRESLFNDGVAVEEVEGLWGRALRARVRSAEGMMDLRFVGIDGPRWMLRAVFQGPAAVDPLSSGPLMRSLRGLVINRGRDAMPAKEALPLTYPREHVEAMKAAAAAVEAGAATLAAPAPLVGDAVPDGPAIGSGTAAAGRGSHRAPEPPEPPTGSIYESGAYESDAYESDADVSNGNGVTGSTYGRAPRRGSGTVYGSSPEYGTSPYDPDSPFRSDHGHGAPTYGDPIYGDPTYGAQTPNGNGSYSGGRNGNDAAPADVTPVRRRPSPRPRRSE